LNNTININIKLEGNDTILASIPLLPGDIADRWKKVVEMLLPKILEIAVGECLAI